MKRFSYISKVGDLYEGADMGILVSRGRMMTDDFKKNARAKVGLMLFCSKYATQIVEDKNVLLNGTLTTKTV
jgi:hypothetical protein